MNFQKVILQFKDIDINGDIIPSGITPQILILHGGGSANISRYRHLRIRLAEKGFSSYAFDYIGHGETGGELEGSSLKERADLTIEAIKQMSVLPDTILGSSMGAYTAIRMLEHFDIKNLILFVPAIYSDESYEIPFGPQFTMAITKPFSWEKSVAWDLLSKFGGNLLVVKAEKDEVIPKELIVKIFNTAINANHKEIHTVNGATHSLTRFLNENPENLELLTKQVTNFINFSLNK
jgi:uncharacterized protein